MNSFICIFVCVYQALQNSLVYTISVISVFVSYTYVCYVLVYFVLYVYNCMHKRTIKYLVSCILYLLYYSATYYMQDESWKGGKEREGERERESMFVCLF